MKQSERASWAAKGWAQSGPHGWEKVRRDPGQLEDLTVDEPPASDARTTDDEFERGE